MLTRLKVDGFKNLIDVDLRFGPFTCIAGANGVGKSNVFDAIAFLGRLADATFVEAAAAVRSDGDEGAELSDILFRAGECSRDRLSFECELLVPRFGEDDLGQPAGATSTLLRYSLELRLASDHGLGGARLELVREELVHINKSTARKSHLPFVGKGGGERFESVFINDRKGGPFISTVIEGGERKVRLHQDGRSVDGGKRRGRTLAFLADRLPRTVLSSTSAVESPTATIVRRELRSWRRLQLEVPATIRPLRCSRGARRRRCPHAQDAARAGDPRASRRCSGRRLFRADRTLERACRRYPDRRGRRGRGTTPTDPRRERRGRRHASGTLLVRWHSAVPRARHSRAGGASRSSSVWRSRRAEFTRHESLPSSSCSWISWSIRSSPSMPTIPFDK